MYVRSQYGFVEEFSTDKIVDAITKDVIFLKNNNGNTNITYEVIKKIATKVYKQIEKMELLDDEILSSDTIRGLVISELYKIKEVELAKISEIIGIRVSELMSIWQGNAYADNANINGKTPEAQHKYIADSISKKGALRLLPNDILHAHISGRLHCLSGEMPIVYKINDNIYINTIKEFCKYFKLDIDYFVPSLNIEKNIVEWKKVINVIMNEPEQLYNVEFTKGKNIICTKDHPFYRTTGETITKKSPLPLSKLSIGNRIATLNYIPNNINDIETYKGNLIGFFLGDGTVQKNKCGFNLRKIEKIQYLENILNNLNIVYTKKTYNLDTYISFYNEELYNLWHNCKILEYFKEEDILGIIGGLINSDGHIRLHGNNKIPYLEFDNTNEYIINLYYILMLSNGINPSKQKYNDCYRCICSGKNITILLKKLRLRDPYNDILSSEYKHGEKITDIWSQTEIKSISEDKIDYTFDITVEDNHNFLAGNGFILSGNCHDLDYFANRPFCNEMDLRYFFYYGLYSDGTGDSIPVALPAKNEIVAVLHAAKALGSGQGNFAGGQGWQNFLTFVSPYLEGLPYDRIKQCMQCYIFEMAEMMNARGGQAVFSTTQLTPGVPDIWKDKPCVYAGKVWDGIQAPRRNYGEFEREVRLAFKAYTEVMLHGDAFGRPFSFPKYEIELLSEHFDPETWEDTLLHPDYSRKLEKHDTEHKNYAALSEYVLAPSYKELWMDVCRLIVRDGTPYIHNSLNLEKGTVSCYSCCAYNFESNNKTDKDFDDKMNFRNGKHFILGSLQVVTLNLPQAAYEGKTFEGFINHVNESISMAIKLFKIKKEHISKQSLLFARQTPTDPNNPELRAPPLWDELDLPCAIGIVGLNEAVQALTGKQIHEDPTSHKMAIKLLTHIQFAVRDASKKHDIKLAFARTPAETTAQRFAICDLINPKYSDIAKKIIKGDVEYALDNINETKDLPIFYTNGAMVTDGANIPLFEKIRLEEHAFSSFDGGNILHIWMGEKSPDPAGILSFITHLVQNTNIKYFTFTKDYSICKNCNTMIPGLVDQCHICKSDDITQFSRVTGYVQAVKGKNISGWNQAKQKELEMRKRYEVV